MTTLLVLCLAFIMGNLLMVAIAGANRRAARCTCRRGRSR